MAEVQKFNRKCQEDRNSHGNIPTTIKIDKDKEKEAFLHY